MLAPIIIVLVATAILGLCWHGANGGSLVPARLERRRWQRVAEQARAERRSPESPRLASPSRLMERPAAEPWLSADELFEAAQAAAEREVAGLSAEVDAMMGRLGPDRRVSP